MAKKLERVFRDRNLTPDEVARDVAVRQKVQKEFPPTRNTAGLSSSTFSETLRHSIRNSNRSVDEIAGAAGVPVALIAGFLSGERDIHMTTADKLADSLGLRLVAN